MRGVQGSVKMALAGAIIAAPLAGAAGVMLTRPSNHMQVIFRGLELSHDDKSYPQFDGADPNFAIDPDATQDQNARSRSCAPDQLDCDTGDDEIEDEVYRT
jgi:hypothetical protein